MKIFRICEVACVALLAVFIGIMISDTTGGSDKTAQEIAAAVLEAETDETVKQVSDEAFKKSFGLNAGDYEGVVYYAAPEIMDVTEILVIKLKDESQGEAALSAISDYASTQANIFNGYGDNQSELLSANVCVQSGNCILFAVSANVRQIKDAFYKAL